MGRTRYHRGVLVRADGRFPVGSLAWQTRGGSHALTVVCTVTHVLAPDRSLLAEEQPPPREVDSTWNEDGTGSLWAPGDLVPRKRRVDVLVGGHAYSAGGEAVTSLAVRLVAGSLNKALVARGDRVWTAHDRLTAAAPFTSMPLRWELAAGGPGTSNPVGVPPDPPADESGFRPVPNLLPPRAVVLSPGQEIPPAGLGPLAPSWPDRAARAGRHAAVFSHAGNIVAPLPEDLDFGCFNAAPPDQQMDSVGPLLPLVLEHLHVEHAMLLTEVPAEPPTAFVTRAGGAIEELRLACDTIWIDPYRGTCTLTFRGVVALRHPGEEGVVVVMEPGAPLPRALALPARREVEPPPGVFAPPPPPLPAPSSGVAARVEPAAEPGVPLLGDDDVVEEGDEAEAHVAAEDDGSETTLVGPAAADAAEDDGSETTLVGPAAAPAALRVAVDAGGGDVDWNETTMSGPAPDRGEGLFAAPPGPGRKEGGLTAPPALVSRLPVALEKLPVATVTPAAAPASFSGVFAPPPAPSPGLFAPPPPPAPSPGAFAPPPPAASAPVEASDEEAPRRPMTLVLGQASLASVKLGAVRRGFFEEENRTHTMLTPLPDDTKKALPFEAPVPAPGPPPRSPPRFEGEDSTRTIDLATLSRAAAPVPFKEAPKRQRAWTMVEVTQAATPALPFARAETAETAVPAVPVEEIAPALPFQSAEPGPRRGKTWLPVPSTMPVLPFQAPGDVAPASPGVPVEPRVPLAGAVIEPAATGMFATSPEPAATGMFAASPGPVATGMFAASPEPAATGMFVASPEPAATGMFAASPEPAAIAALSPEAGHEPLLAQVIAPAAPAEAAPLSVFEYTEIKCEIWLGGGLAEVLGRRGMDEVEWRAEERRQAERLAAEMSEGKCELALALADALREARARARAGQPAIVVAPDTGLSVAVESA